MPATPRGRQPWCPALRGSPPPTPVHRQGFFLRLTCPRGALWHASGTFSPPTTQDGPHQPFFTGTPPHRPAQAGIIPPADPARTRAPAYRRHPAACLPAPDSFPATEARMPRPYPGGWHWSWLLTRQPAHDVPPARVFHARGCPRGQAVARSFCHRLPTRLHSCVRSQATSPSSVPSTH